MRRSHAAILSALGMTLSAASVYSLTPPGGIPGEALAVPEAAPLASADLDAPDGPVALATGKGRFALAGTVALEGRLGHATLLRKGGETFVLLELEASGASAGAERAPIALSIVVDRSGSMKGTRILNAVRAAQRAVEGLRDGDQVSVFAFDTQARELVPPTTVDAGSRGRILADIAALTLGGDTCISCGLEKSLERLGEAPSGFARRMILLTDGEATHGVRDVPGFRAFGQRALQKDVHITGIGVDVEFSEKVLSALAQESNGRFHFVENDATLDRVFTEEAEALARTVASEAEVAVELGRGVELERVFDRTFRRSGGTVVVPLGAFSEREVKTVLLKVRVQNPGGDELDLAHVELRYRNAAEGREVKARGKLVASLTASPAEVPPLDDVVSARVQRSGTTAALREANELLGKGKADEARRRLDEEKARVEATLDRARGLGGEKAEDLARDAARQKQALAEASAGLAAAASPAPASAPPRAAKAAARRIEAQAFDNAF